MKSETLRKLELAGLAALILVTIVGFALWPSYPNYDSVYSLIWGSELLHGNEPSFEAFRAPTQHPLAIALAVLLYPLGGLADHALVLLALLSFVAVVVAVYRLGRDAFAPLVGLAAALVMLSRFDFPYLAVRAYIDIPFMAFVLWAAVLEYQRPRRGGVVWVLLAAAGLLRPEAWALLGLYWLWMSFGEGATWPLRLKWAAYAAAPAIVWVLIDLAVTGDPLYSQHATSETVASLDRGEELADLPSALAVSMTELVKPPVILAGLAGIALAVALVPRRALMPGIVLLSGIATFLAIGAAGFAVIDRYLIVAAAAFCIFAGFAIAGFSALERFRALRIAWAVGAAAIVVAVVAFTVARTLALDEFNADLEFRSEANASLERVLDSEVVASRIDRGCGPVTTPTHKIVPDVRWILDAGEDEVISRSDPVYDPNGAELAILAQGRRALDKQAFDGDTPATTQLPPADGELIASDRYYSVWARCEL
ncbi:MAG: ArnT family glycosyltransferase [Solirubrobacterales bacterium]